MPNRRKPPVDVKQVEELAARGLSREKIALAIGMCESTFSDREKKNPEITAAIDRGRASGEKDVANALFEAATVNKNVNAMIFYLKTRCGWTERQQVELQGSQQVTLHINDDLTDGAQP